MAEIKTTNAVNTIEIVQSGKTGGIGPTGPTGPPGAISASSSLVITGSLFTSGSGGHITASGDISSSANIYGQDYYSNGQKIIDYDGAKIRISNQPLDIPGNITASGNISASGDLEVRHITASGNISASGTIYADNFSSANSDVAGISFTDDTNIVGHITASGNISSSGTISGFSASFARINFDNAASQTTVFSGSATQTGSIGHMIIGDQSLQIGGTAGTRFTKTNLDDLKAGRSIRDTSGLSAKTYTLDDGRKINRKYEQRFNRWAPNLSFEDDEEGEDVSADFEETDSIPQTYVDLSDRQLTAVIQQGLTKYVQTTTDIAISSSGTANNTAHIHSPTITLASGRTDNQALVSITGSLSISGSNTFTNWGNFKNRMHQDRHYFTVTTNPWATGGWKDNLGHSVTTPALTGSAPHLHVQLSGSGQVGVGTLAPEHTLHVSASSNNFNALQVEGASQFNGFAGGMTFANATAISADVVVPSNYNAVLWVSTYNPSITVNAGTNYTINTGADVRIADMSTI